MSRHSDRSRPGIRVKHLQCNKADTSQVSSILSVSGFIEESLMSRPSIFGSSKTPDKQRKKIFEGRSKSPAPAEEGQSSLEIVQLEEVEILFTHNPGEPIVLPNKPVYERPQVANPSPVMLNEKNGHTIQKTRPDLPPQILKEANKQLEVGSLQHFLKQPPHVRQQLMHQMNPQGQSLEHRMPTRPVIMGIRPSQPHQVITAERLQPHQTAYFPPQQTAKVETTPARFNNVQYELEGRLADMQTVIDKLLQKLDEKEKTHKELQGKLESMVANRDGELQRKDAEISQHIIQIEQLSDALSQARKEAEQAKQQATRQKHQRELDKAASAYAQAELQARLQAKLKAERETQATSQASSQACPTPAQSNMVYSQPTALPPASQKPAQCTWQPSFLQSKAYQDSTHEQQSYLSPLSVNTNRSIDHSLPRFPFM